MVLHLWLVMMWQQGTHGGNVTGSIKMQGYALFLPVDSILVDAWGKVRAHHCPSIERPVARYWMPPPLSFN